MKTESNTLQNLVRYSLLASIATLLQISVIFLPGLGRILGAFNTLPIALAARISPRGGILCYIISTWLTLVMIPSEAPLLVLCTGPLGVALGWGLHLSAGKRKTALSGALIFMCGLLLITLLLGLPVFGPILQGKGLIIMLGFYAGFAWVYSYAWLRMVKKMVGQLERMGVRL